ncbi:MAG TPA: SLC13 family permease [Candidatus Binatia bacterium]|nr:SLC13 family permease [Candidatus Binatia bacterium]
MMDLQTGVTLGVFAAVVLAIALELLDIAVAALLGVSSLIVSGILTAQDMAAVAQASGGTIALLFGGMVVARTLAPTGIFEHVGTRFLLATGGSGKRFLLGLLALVAPVCAFLPNATVVILLAPVVMRVAIALEIDFVGPLVLTAIISNSAGLLTLVGDPATFLVGSSISMTFGEYLRRVSFGGLLALLVLVVLLPWVFGGIWRVRRTLPEDVKPKALERPYLCVLTLTVLTAMILLFLFGDLLPVNVVPPAAAIVGCSLALLVVYAAKVEPVERVLQDLDWRTLIFLSCMFLLVQAFTKTGILQGLSRNLYGWFGVEMLPVAFFMLGGVGVMSSLLANIPVVAAMIVVIKGYFVLAQVVPEEALGVLFSNWPASTLPVFVGMMFGATLGGNATLIGASANVVAAGICAGRGKPVSFGTFLRYGVPFTLAQLLVSALYVLGMNYMIGD